MKVQTFLLLWALVVGFVYSQDKLLWQQCSTITLPLPFVGNVSFDQCTQLISTQDCTLLGRLTLNGQEVFRQGVDLAGKQICSPLPAPFSSCQGCFNLKPHVQLPTQECAVFDVTCGLFPLPSQTLGCFDSVQILNDLLACQYKCPNDCSGKGTCDKGVCVCDVGYYGQNCNVSIPTYRQCVSIPLGEIVQSVCAEFQFVNCQVVFNVKLGVGETVLYSQTFPLYQFMNMLKTPYCLSAFNCSLCIEWNNLELNENRTGGCSQISVSGCGFGKRVYPLFCFQDTQIVDYCLGRCPNDCSFHGICNSGVCQCDSNFGANDCSEELLCPNQCSSHGICQQGLCVCDQNFQGSDCSLPLDTKSTSKKQKSGDAYLWVILGVVTLLVVGVVAGVVIYFKIRDKRDREGFMKLELEESSNTDSRERLSYL